MNVRIRFLGGAGSVTGSRFLLEIDNYKLLIDCGLFQGLKELRLRNWDDFPVDPKSINAIVLTHGHIDHSGYLPRLVKQGFNGTIHCTSPTEDLLEVLLTDAAKLQEEEAGWAKKKGYSKHENPQPLFTSEDVLAYLSILNGHNFQERIKISDTIVGTFQPAGHILGASSILLEIFGNQQTKTILFSGDLGRDDDPIHGRPQKAPQADVLFIESTYGNRNHHDGNIEQEFASIINDTINHGCLLIPSFAVGRTQLLLFYIEKLLETNQIPAIPVYVDSPMAISATSLYRKHLDNHILDDEDLRDIGCAFDHPLIKYHRLKELSANLNTIKTGAVIISASGMCTGGRILHHLYHRLPRANDTVLFVGYQADGTRGRRILNGEPTIRIFGVDVPVHSRISNIDGLSAHADQQNLLHWLDNISSAPKRTFVVHGEKENSEGLASKIRLEKGWDNVIVPQYLESLEIFEGI
ncbi:MAG: MBL fold metallo-hydrolase [Bacteroidetes bacterium]|nr:MBL fold metallo-hydrolase [Bacteroidota bacterium]MDA1120395.1 MBL fold metallo-hydrolase [Bacteroidota bacterium]